MSFVVRLQDPEGRVREVRCPPGRTVLDAAEDSGLALPYSCRSAACATCAGRVVEGTVALDDQYVLGTGDLARGFTLLCSASPTSDCTILTHQQAAVDGV
ncbi:MAG: apoferredoxin [Pseudomonadota bacterium]|jgi:ferredoxin